MNDSHLKDLDESIFDLLSAIRKKPPLYLGDTSLIRLEAFLAGHGIGLGKMGVALKDQGFLQQFNDWLASKFGYSSSMSGWCNMILEHSENDQKALGHFFELLDEFKKEKGWSID